MNLKSQQNPGICGRGVSTGRKGASGAENSFRTVLRLRKTGVGGRKGLAKPLPGTKIAGNQHNHHEHEANWEVPAKFLSRLLIDDFFAGALSSVMAQTESPQSPMILPSGATIKTFPAPPAGFNPLTSDEATLLSYGLPRRPIEDPERVARWDKLIGRPTRFIEPTFRRTDDRRHGPRIRRATDATDESSNWSGSVMFLPAGSTFASVYGQWAVPTPNPASASNTPYYSSFWVGIDGDGSNDVCQAGVECDAVNAGSSTQRTIYPWWEWYPENEVQITNFPVSAGDVLICAINIISTTEAGLVFQNVTGGHTTSFLFTAPSGTRLTGNCAEWIAERPEVGGTTSTLANYNEVDFSGCVAHTNNGAPLQPSAANNLDMYDGSPSNIISRGTLVSPETIKCVYTGPMWTPAGEITHTIRHSDGSWQNPAGNATPEFGGGTFVGVANSGVGNDVQFVGLRSNGQVMHTMRHPDGSWQNPAGDATGDLGGGTFVAVACAGIGGDLQVCGLRSDGQVMHTIRRSDGSWQNPAGNATSDFGGGTFSGIACSQVGNDVQFVGVRPNGQVMHTIRHPDGSWQNPAGDATGDLGGGTFVAVACAGIGGDLQVCGLRASGQIMHTIRRSDGSWQHPAGDATGDFGGAPFAHIACARVASDVQFVGVRPNGQVMHTIRHPDGSWQNPAGNATGDLGGATYAAIGCAGIGGDLQVAAIVA